MADTVNKPARSLSPFLTIFRWPVTMATSIVHRATGVGLAGGLAVLVWWLFAVSNGQETYGFFYRIAITTIGQMFLYGFVWALCYHFFNGIRHLAWDAGYGFSLRCANRSGFLVAALSLVAVAAIFVVVHFGLGGYYQ